MYVYSYLELYFNLNAIAFSWQNITSLGQVVSLLHTNLSLFCASNASSFGRVIDMEKSVLEIFGSIRSIHGPQSCSLMTAVSLITIRIAISFLNAGWFRILGAADAPWTVQRKRVRHHKVQKLIWEFCLVLHLSAVAPALLWFHQDEKTIYVMKEVVSSRFASNCSIRYDSHL